MAGPATTRVMADFGATVVRIETQHHLDVARTIGPFVKDVPGNDSSGLLFNMTTGKRSIGARPAPAESGARCSTTSCAGPTSSSSRSRRAAGRRSASTTSGCTSCNPGLIMMSSCLFGQTGPLRRYAGFGTMGASLAGFFHLTGWPDRPPCGPFGAYSDYLSPRFALCAAARRARPPPPHRRGAVPRLRPGRGVRPLPHRRRCSTTPSTATSWTRNGNADPDDGRRTACTRPPGDDQWVAIACRDDADWRALAELRRSPRPGRRWRTDERLRPARRARRRSSRRGPPHGRPTTSTARADRRRRARPRRAELRRVRGRPAAGRTSGTS